MAHIYTMGMVAPRPLSETGTMRAASENRRFAPWLAYPGTMALGIGLWAALLAAGIPTAVATYLAVSIGVVVILLLEKWIPYRRCWHRPCPEARQ